jgi:hypothetical protein
MAIKKIEMAICDFNHKHDKPAVKRIKIDVCAIHDHMFEGREADPLVCEYCNKDTFKTLQGLNNHITRQHPGKKHMKVVEAAG